MTKVKPPPNFKSSYPPQFGRWIMNLWKQLKII